MLRQFKLANDLLIGSSTNSESGNKNKNSLSIFLNKPFWIWDKEKHDIEFLISNGNCCFNHIVGLPVKNDKEYPIFDFQKLIYDAVQQDQNIWILKARGIGITTFLIRYLAWKILSYSELENKSIFIISGTREEHANYIKEKLQQLFEKKFPFLKLESKYTELWLQKTWIKVFPTKNIKDIRGYFEASYIWVDESDHMEPSIQEELFHAIGPYEEKSNCKILLSSTPNRPDGLMQQIEQDKKSKYTKLKLDYTYSLDLIYDRAFIQKKKLDEIIKASAHTNQESILYTVKFASADSKDGQMMSPVRGQFSYDQFVNWTFDDLYKLQTKPWKEQDPNYAPTTRTLYK